MQSRFESKDILKTRFAVEFHCGAAECKLRSSFRLLLFRFSSFSEGRRSRVAAAGVYTDEVRSFLASRRGRRMSKEEIFSLLERIRLTVHLSVADNSEDVKIKCAFTSDVEARMRILHAAQTNRGIFRRAQHMIGQAHHGISRFLRRPLTNGTPARGSINEAAFLQPAEFSPRRQLPGEWRRFVEANTHAPFWHLQRLTAQDEPEATLEGPVDLLKLNEVGDRVLVASDYDDTLVASGGWRLKGLGHFVGGVDDSFPRGVSYPGLGGLMYLLSMGSRKREADGAFRAVETPELPLMLLSARPSIKIMFRPSSLYKHIALAYTHEAAMLGAGITARRARVKYENHVSIFSALGGKSPASDLLTRIHLARKTGRFDGRMHLHACNQAEKRGEEQK
ncbi:hypothetical protein Efla_002192 [Eimeria flavescens]